MDLEEALQALVETAAAVVRAHIAWGEVMAELQQQAVQEGLILHGYLAIMGHLVRAAAAELVLQLCQPAAAVAAVGGMAAAAVAGAAAAADHPMLIPYLQPGLRILQVIILPGMALLASPCHATHPVP